MNTMKVLHDNIITPEIYRAEHVKNLKQSSMFLLDDHRQVSCDSPNTKLGDITVTS